MTKGKIVQILEWMVYFICENKTPADTILTQFPLYYKNTNINTRYKADNT